VARMRSIIERSARKPRHYRLGAIPHVAMDAGQSRFCSSNSASPQLSHNMGAKICAISSMDIVMWTFDLDSPVGKIEVGNSELVGSGDIVIAEYGVEHADEPLPFE